MQEKKRLSKLIHKLFSPDKNCPDKANISSKEEILDLLVEGIGNLERGLRVLDHHLILTKEPLDILALDLLGELVIIELEVGENENIILRALEHFDWILHNINAIVQKYSREKIDTTLAPRIIFISQSFSDNFLRKLSYVNTTRIDLYEYNLKNVEGITHLEFRPHAFSLSENKIIEINRPRLEGLISFIRAVSLRQSCYKLIKEVRDFNNRMSVDTSSGYIEIKRDNACLLRIYPQPGFFWVSLNPKGKWQGIKVESERQAEEVLGQIKKLVSV